MKILLISLFWQQFMCWMIFSIIVTSSYFYLQDLFKLIKFRENLHAEDIVAYKYGKKVFVSEVQNIPNGELVEIRDLHSNRIMVVSSHRIFPL